MGSESKKTTEYLEKIKNYLKKITVNAYSKTKDVFWSVPYKIYESRENNIWKIVSDLSSFLLKVLAVLLVFLGAFYPSLLLNVLWVLILLIVVLAVILIFIRVVLPTIQPEMAVIIYAVDEMLDVSKEVKSYLIKILIIVISFFFVFLLPSPNYEKLFMRAGLGSIHYTFFMLVSLIFVVVIPLAESNVNFVLMYFLYASFLYFLIPYIFFLSTTACLETNPIYKIPYISDIFSNRICGRKLQKTSLVVRGKVINVPIAGGLGIKIGYDSYNYLPAGHKYSDVIILSNYYEDPEDPNRSIQISILKPYIYSPRYKVYFVPTDFLSTKWILKPGEVYGMNVIFKPEMLEIVGNDCLYTLEQLNKSYWNIECAYDSPCESLYGNLSSKCIKIDYLRCECIDWIKVTCSGEKLHIGVEVIHDGFIIGNGTLYYFEKYSPGARLVTYSYSQGPASMKFDFAPNPWIREMYENYINEVDMFGSIQIFGREPRVNSISVTPIDTKVIINDYFNNKTIIESIEIRPIECTDVSEINELLMKTGKWSGLLCKFTPPQINLKIVDIKTNETSLNVSVSLAMLDEYCKYNIANITGNVSKNITYDINLYKQYLNALEKIRNMNEELRSTINEYGLCGLIKRTYQYQNETLMKEKKILEEALKKIDIYVRVEYITTTRSQSPRIIPYWTSRCDEVKNLNKKNDTE